jgi:hypothetical protein
VTPVRRDDELLFNWTLRLVKEEGTRARVCTRAVAGEKRETSSVQLEVGGALFWLAIVERDVGYKSCVVVEGEIAGELP